MSKGFSMRLWKSRRYRSYSDLPAPRKKEVVIATSFDSLIEVFPKMNRGNRPKWWTSLPATESSYRRCHGITDLMQLGWTVEAWCDFKVVVDGANTRIEVSSHQFRAETFSHDQVGKCPITEHTPDEVHFPKFVSPYYVRTPKGWSCMLVHHPLNYDPRYRVMPGIVHTDYFHDMHCVINVMSNETFVIKAGTPLFQVIPFRRADRLDTIVPAPREMQVHMEGTVFKRGGVNLGPDNRRGRYRQGLAKVENEMESRKSFFSWFKPLKH